MARISKGRPIKWIKIGSALIVLILLLVLLLGHDSATGEASEGHIDLVTRLEVDRFGIGQPARLTSDLMTGTLLLNEGEDNSLHTISTFGDLLATEKLENIPDSVEHIEYNARSGSLFMFDPGQRQLLAIPWEHGRSGGAASEGKRTAITLPLAATNGIAADPSSGDIYLLDGNSLHFIRVDAAGIGEQARSASPQAKLVSTISLGGEVDVLQGLAFDPVSRHLFSTDPKRHQLIEFTLTGEQVKIYDLSPFNLPEPEGLAFAPSTNQTDAPANTSLYISGGEADIDIWEFTFALPAASSIEATTSSLVQTIEVWQFSPPSPDASGVTYLPGSGTLLETDSEVNEKPIYENVNQFEIALTGAASGTLINTYDTTHFSNEPTGVAYDPSRNHLFFSDDNIKKIHEADLNYKLVRSFAVGILDGKAVDPEGIAYNTRNGRLYIAGGTSETIFWIDPGLDGDFGTSDDLEGSFPATYLRDPEGITFNTDSGNLYAVGKDDVVAEYTVTGSVVQLIDISDADARKPAGLAYGPSSLGSGKSIYVSDRGVDLDSEINGGLGDGKIYEFLLESAPAPKANFEGSPRSGPVALTVNFINISTSIYDTCEWDFGDNQSSSECHNISHTYSNVGKYSVSLTVTGPGGSSTNKKTNYIQVGIPAHANFSGDPTTGLVPQTVTFVNESSGDYETCEWDFGDGGTSNSCDTNVIHTYAVGGQFTVSLTVSGIGGESIETKAGYIIMYEVPTADFNASPTQGWAPLSVQFTNLSRGDYDTCSWNFGDGSSSSMCANPRHVYASPGIYTVELALDGAFGADTTKKIDFISVGLPRVQLPLIFRH
jgi:PKD repeat protein